MNDLAGRKTPAIAERMTMPDLYYSFGTCHPGAVTLHNYPRHLQNSPGTMESISIWRRWTSCATANAECRATTSSAAAAEGPGQVVRRAHRQSGVAEESERYTERHREGGPDTGLYAEPLPEGFGFSETAFRIFILMASRRLKSDRFFTDDYRPEIYTEIGIEYVRKNSMLSVVRRHIRSSGARSKA